MWGIAAMRVLTRFDPAWCIAALLWVTFVGCLVSLACQAYGGC